MPTKEPTIGSRLQNEMELNISNNVLLFDGSQLNVIVPWDTSNYHTSSTLIRQNANQDKT